MKPRVRKVQQNTNYEVLNTSYKCFFFEVFDIFRREGREGWGGMRTGSIIF